MCSLLKMLLFNVWRKLKYYFLYLSIVCFIYVTLSRLIGLSAEKPKSSVNLRYVAVHIDLKGSPPKITYLVSLLPVLSIYGVNAILMEYEDMFPYVDSIAKISSSNAYKRTELLMFINSAKNLKMEIIPLIQTFGHMEYVLKLKEFAHLRERKKSHKDICPSNPESKVLITTMLKQVIDLHAIIYPLQHIHVGCDEVRNLNVCPKCKKRRLKSGELFIDHVKEVTSIVKEINPSLKVLIWADMLLKPGAPKMYNIHNVEAVSWAYGATPQFSHTYFYNLHHNFKNIWIGTAFKGADGNNATIPNIRHRFLNHMSWLDFILGYKFGGEKNVYNFKGIILTGWSRYTHTAPQCELLPIAMPSLVLNLLLIRSVQSGIDEGPANKISKTMKYVQNCTSTTKTKRNQGFLLDKIY
ncbi:hypothetical protein PYW08_009693 [Mythimna loreyi]|uniref:Uncharacterized protein n=1 Tax=Mythimna loreyi TaxID=667449 RepID=A0ACC2Q6P7_9NEOP|nr:hypothetical protein PYW08_009693 [Mythimna loreyi]